MYFGGWASIPTDLSGHASALDIVCNAPIEDLTLELAQDVGQCLGNGISSQVDWRQGASRFNPNAERSPQTSRNSYVLASRR